MSTFYPDFPENIEFSLIVVIKALEENPNYLNEPDCPYHGKLREMLQHLAPKVSPELISTEEFKARTDDQLEREVTELLDDIKSFGAKLSVDDVTERMSYYRTHTNLLEKLVSMKERMGNVKSVATFQAIVLNCIEESLTADQRTQVMDNLHQQIQTGVIPQ
ncbi:hypothetical protein [Cupriavidus sp. RAF12]|uniref:hypothetical protein n=1 Tax=Cupriavidus sp. RAF12 TaxID=3233050 RepID=UPI003F8F7BBA